MIILLIVNISMFDVGDKILSFKSSTKAEIPLFINDLEKAKNDDC